MVKVTFPKLETQALASDFSVHYLASKCAVRTRHVLLKLKYHNVNAISCHSEHGGWMSESGYTPNAYGSRNIYRNPAAALTSHNIIIIPDTLDRTYLYCTPNCLLSHLD